MGIRPSQHKKGGGFLNGVVGTIVGVRFTDEFNGEAYEAGKIKVNGKTIDKPHRMYATLEIRPEGATDTIAKEFSCGNYDAFEVSEDEQTLTSPDGGECTVSSNCALSILLTSMCTTADPVFPEERLSDDPNSLNLEPIVGCRVRFEQRDNAEKTKEFGKRKSKQGKEFNRQDLVITAVYDLPEDAVAAAPKRGVKVAAAPVKTAAKGKATGRTPEDVEALAIATIIDLVTDAGGSIHKQKFSTGVIQKLTKDPDREVIRKMVVDDSFLAKQDGWSYDKGTKTVSVEME